MSEEILPSSGTWPDGVKRMEIEIDGRMVAFVRTHRAPPGLWYLADPKVLAKYPSKDEP